MDDTIVALSTPAGEAALAVIRLSGPESFQIINDVFRSSEKEKLQSRTASHGWIMDGNEPVDEVVITVFQNPRSYTGEDVAEVACHGGIFVTRQLIELFIRHGARPARPGEFTQRAFINGKMDLSQAEAVADLIRAKTEASRRVAVYQLEGHLSRRLEAMRNQLMNSCSLLEIELDFAEEDLTFTPREDMMVLLYQIQNDMETLLDTFRRGQVCREGIRMVIVGRTNVGKSSLLNALIEKERAIVTEYPGTTRDTVDDVLDIEGVLFTITDTAGLRTAGDPVEQEGIRRTEKALEKADFILLVLDKSQPWCEEDAGLISRFHSGDTPFIVVLNKKDLKAGINPVSLKSVLKNAETAEVSALRRTGIDNLIKMIRQKVLSGKMPHEGDVLLTSVRHRHCLEKARECIVRSRETVKSGMSQEFTAMEIRGAVDALEELAGETTPEDVLNHIFNNFCIGK